MSSREKTSSSGSVGLAAVLSVCTAMVGQVGLLYMRLNMSKVHVSLHVRAEQRLPLTVLPSFNHS